MQICESKFSNCKDFFIIETQAQDENKSTGNLQVKMEKSHESIKAEVDKIYEKIENNEETPKDLIKENREDEKEIEKLKIEVSLTTD